MFELQMRVMDTSLGKKWWEDKLFRLRESIAMKKKACPGKSFEDST